jgi:hypothetical protein
VYDCPALTTLHAPFFGKLIANDGQYTLVAHPNGTFSAGCQKHLTSDKALSHWARDDARAKLFTASIQK